MLFFLVLTSKIKKLEIIRMIVEDPDERILTRVLHSILRKRYEEKLDDEDDFKM